MTEAQLARLFKEYKAERGPEGAVRQRNKAMLGLLTYQALTTAELARLEVEDIDLEGGMVEVPGSRTSNGRTLYLEGSQVLGLHVYLAEARSRLLAEASKASNRLFVSAGGGSGLNNALSILVRELKEGYGWFENARQLRSSRIALWLKSHDLREVQYMAGHRYVSSTEKYRAADLDALHKSLTRFHPLR